MPILLLVRVCLCVCIIAYSLTPIIDYSLALIITNALEVIIAHSYYYIYVLSYNIIYIRYIYTMHSSHNWSRADVRHLNKENEVRPENQRG